MIEIIICAAIAYLLGSIPSGLWIGKYFFNTDIRQYGSGNLGATNTFRVLGKKAGAIVLLMDLFKGSLSILIASHFHLNGISPLIIGLFAVLGHTFPLFANFRGGKAVATFAGIILAYQPWLFFGCFLIFLIILSISKMVSLTSMLTITIGVIITFFIHDWTLTIIALIVDLFIIYRHRSNITRILNGTENKINLFSKQNKE